MKVVIFLGPPGAGKGSLSQLCKEYLGWRQLSTGNLCRRHIDRGTSIGKEIDFAIKSGKLISDSLISDMVRQWFIEEKTLESVILDGFPRTVSQAEQLQHLVEETGTNLSIIRLNISDEQVIKRLSTRYICQNHECQQVYSLGNPAFTPKKLMICDYCQYSLGKRKDDEESSVQERLRIYHQHAQKLITFYQEKGFKICELNVDQPLQKIFEELGKLMGLV